MRANKSDVPKLQLFSGVCFLLILDFIVQCFEKPCEHDTALVHQQKKDKQEARLYSASVSAPAALSPLRCLILSNELRRMA